MRRVMVGAAAVLILAAPTVATGQANTAQEDAYLWLEEVEGMKALGWATDRSQTTLNEFEALPVFQELESDALGVLVSADRIAYPQIRGDHLYNFWTDEGHPRGIYRRTTWESYLTGDPTWETVIDVDALSAEEGTTWAYRGLSCLAPENRHCLLSLSRGGADATEIREFDLHEMAFVEDGFVVPEAKNGAAFIDPNTLLVATDFGVGSKTTSGYPRTVRTWKRGEPLDGANAIFEAPETDMATFTGTWEVGDQTYGVVTHLQTIFERVSYVFKDGELIKVDTPPDAATFISGDQLVVRTVSPWTVNGRTYESATVLAMDAEAFLDGERDFDVVAESGGKRFIQSATPTKDHLLVQLLDNVQGELWRYSKGEDGWVGEKLPAPAMGNVGVVANDPHSNRFFFTYSGFTQPSTLYLAQEDGEIEEIRSLPPQFDTEGLEVMQHEATSKDGTKIPFFIVHKEGLEHDGRNATLLNAYGGFQIPRTAGYNPMLGKTWLERGGVYVLANIRGGGEFGPDWWTAALKENRQRAYDDFLAVAEWLVDHDITSADHLGIMGGSNGGLLVGVAMTQRPDLFNAVVVQVPLLDMKRYHTLLAGASWMAEYGDPDNPDDWAYISQYSPYQNVKPDVDYPRALFTTTTRDDRVHPGHARKMAAKMTDQGHDVLYFENTEGGHGSGVTPEQQAKMYALTYAYLWTQLSRERGVS